MGKAFSPHMLRHIVLWQASLLQYAHFVSAADPLYSNSSSSASSTSASSTTSDSNACGAPCTIRIGPTTLRYPNSVDLTVQNFTITVVPYVTTYSDGRRVTHNSTFQYYATNSSSEPYAPVATTDLIWQTLGTTLTYPTTYIAFPSPSLIFNNPVPAQQPILPGPPSCSSTVDPIKLPEASTTKLIFPLPSDGAIDAATASAFSFLDSLPTVTSLLNGGNPKTCSHGLVTSKTPFTTIIVPTVVHTSVAVLTQVAPPVLVAAPPDDNGGGNGNNGGGSGTGGSGTGGSGDNGSGGTSDNGNGNGNSNGGGGGGGGGGLPGLISSILEDNGNGGSAGATPQPQAAGDVGGAPVVVNGATLGPAASGGVVVNGQTVAPGAAITIADGTPVSVAPAGGVVVVGGSTFTLANTGAGTGTGTGTGTGGSYSTSSSSSSSTTTTSSNGVGGAIASGIGLSPSGNMAPGHYSNLESLRPGIGLISGFLALLAAL